MNIREILDSLSLEVMREDYNNFFIICPFHEDTDPSLRVHKIDGRVNCFAGCVKGSIFDLISKKLEIQKEEAIQRFKIKDLYSYDIWSNNFLKKINNESLLNTKQNKHVFLTGVDSKDFVLADNNEKALNYLFSRNLSLETIKRTGFLYNIRTKEIAIPIFDEKNKLISFINRSIESKKYRYIKNFPIKKNLFGINSINSSFRECFLVEGAFDQIKLQEYGFKNVLALFRADVSLEQINVIRKYVSVVNLLLDGDEPGRKATGVIAKKLKEEGGFIVYDIVLEKDPDEYTKKELEFKVLNRQIIWGF